MPPSTLPLIISVTLMLLDCSYMIVLCGGSAAIGIETIGISIVFGGGVEIGNVLLKISKSISIKFSNSSKSMLLLSDVCWFSAVSGRAPMKIRSISIYTNNFYFLC
ncbi:hypothetical protein QL285_053775 [Trifolium repens]|nr:hypothetical protein QL285_053775 [Trifolium repens]